jgi:probable HAF family extracellular repeat protein
VKDRTSTRPPLLAVAALLPGLLSGGAATGVTSGREVAPVGTLSVEPVDLGTLGGDRAVAVAIDEQLVVGAAQTADGAWHAFVVDVTDPQLAMRDLGTLGGVDSVATDVEGSVVVGVSEVSTDQFPHNFVVDLAAADLQLTDLGPTDDADYFVPDQPVSDQLPTVGDGVVTGKVMTKHRPRGPDQVRGFVYDTAAASPEVVTLGTLGGDSSVAVDVDDRVVVGYAERRPGPRQRSATHAFAYDLDSTVLQMVDLGTLGRRSEAVAVESGVVVGNSTTSRPALEERAFLYDLNAPVPQMVDLGTLAGDRSARVWDVQDGLAVGASLVRSRRDSRAAVRDVSIPDSPLTGLGGLGTGSVASGSDGRYVFGSLSMVDNRPTSFVYDTMAPDPEMVEVGPLPGNRWTVVSDADNGVAAGRVGSWWAGDRAVIWPLLHVDQPAVRFSQWYRVARESAGTLTVGLERTGDLTEASSVRYRSLRGTGTRSGHDYEQVSGTATFAPGQSRAMVAVRLIDDRRGETREGIGLTLGAPTDAVIGAVRTMHISVLANDWPPDVVVRSQDTDGSVGGNIYNLTGRGQTLRHTALPGTSSTSKFRVCNDGHPRDSRFRARFTLRASPDQPGSTVTYLRRRRDLTEELRSADGRPLRLEAGGVPCFTLKVRTRVPTSAEPGSIHRAKLTVRSDYDSRSADAGVSAVRVTR